MEHFRAPDFKLGLRGTVRMETAVVANGQIQLENSGDEEIANSILFERRGDRIGYRVGGAVANETVLEGPELTGNLFDLARELAGRRVAQGLYPDEAQAMVETWRGSWFEQGSRLIYIVPEKFVDRILPLSIQPAPAQIAACSSAGLSWLRPRPKKRWKPRWRRRTRKLWKSTAASSNQLCTRCSGSSRILRRPGSSQTVSVLFNPRW